MKRYKVTGLVLFKGLARESSSTVIAADEVTATRIFGRDHDVVSIRRVEDVTDVDTGWDHVAYVRSDSDRDRTHEIRRNRKSSIVACGCHEYRFCRGSKTCHHLRALSVVQSTQMEHVTVGVERKGRIERVTVTRRAISLGPLTMKSIGGVQ